MGRGLADVFILFEPADSCAVAVSRDGLADIAADDGSVGPGVELGIGAVDGTDAVCRVETSTVISSIQVA